MSVFNVPVVIGVDEKRLAEEIEKDAKNQVIDKITEEVKKIIFTESYYGKKLSDEPLRNMVKNEVVNVIKDKQEVIIEAAAKLLAEKMAKTKAVKEAIAKVIDENTGEDE